MPLRLQPIEDPQPTQVEWYDLLAGSCRVGMLRLESPGWKAPYWVFQIHGLGYVTGIEAHGVARTRERCFMHAQACWAEHIKALGLIDAPASPGDAS